MKLSNKQKKAVMKNLFFILEQEQATAVEIPDHNGKMAYVLLRPDIFSDLKTENDQMKFWLDATVRQIFELQDDQGQLKMEGLAEQIRKLNLLAVDGISRFMGYNPADAMKDQLDLGIEEAKVE